MLVKGPGGHHHTGGLYEVHIRLALPDGREVNVERTPPADERYADLTFAIDNAFKRARRQLQDRVRRLQGQVKEHESPPIGTVVRINPSGEFGFLESADGREIYFHRNSVLDNAFSQLVSRLPRDFCRGDGRERTAGEHGEAARKARIAGLTITSRPQGLGNASHYLALVIVSGSLRANDRIREGDGMNVPRPTVQPLRISAGDGAMVRACCRY